MAIRKFRKNLKPFIWVITIAFLLSLVVSFGGNLKGMFGGPQTYAFKVNGVRAEKMDIERNRSGIVDSYANSLGMHINKDVAGIIAVDEVINKKLNAEMAKKLKISVPKNEIEEQFKLIQDSFQDKDQFSRMLSAQGFTRESLKNELSEILTAKKVKEKFNSDAKVSDEEVQKYYDENKYTKYAESTLENVKEAILSQLRGEKAKTEYSLALEKARKEMKITDLQDEYKDYLPKTEIEVNGFSIKNTDMAMRTVTNLYPAKGDNEIAKKMAYDQYVEQTKVAKAAILKDISVNPDLPLEMILEEYAAKLKQKLMSEIIVSEDEVKSYFTESGTRFDKPATADAQVAVAVVEASEADAEAAKKLAGDILKEATPDNFAELAKKYSKDPGTAINGGDLGWFEKGMMVPSFEEAAFKGEVGKIYPELVESDFGYHIIFVQEKNEAEGVRASHILISKELSEETKKKGNEKISEIIKGLKDGTLNFEKLVEVEGNIVKFSQKVSGISETGFLPNLGYDKELADKVFGAKEGDIISFSEDGEAVYIIQKIAETKAEKADISNLEIQERIKAELKDSKVNNEIQKIIKSE